MDKPITGFERVLLFLRATSIKFSKDIAPFPNSYYKRSNGILVGIILFALLDNSLVFLKLHTSVAIVGAFIYLVFDAIIYLFYEDKVDFIVENYYSNYNGYIYAFFIILFVVSAGYMAYLIFNDWSSN